MRASKIPKSSDPSDTSAWLKAISTQRNLEFFDVSAPPPFEVPKKGGQPENPEASGRSEGDGEGDMTDSGTQTSVKDVFPSRLLCNKK